MTFLKLCSRFWVGIILALSITFNVDADVDNGSFESWSNAKPDDWSTIDSGITLERVSSPVADGNYAAKVTIGTSRQANTDLLQRGRTSSSAVIC